MSNRTPAPEDERPSLAPPAIDRISLWRTPGALLLGIAFVGAWIAMFAGAISPVRGRGEANPVFAIAMLAIPCAMLVLAAWRNRHGFASWGFVRRIGAFIMLLLEWLSWWLVFLVLPAIAFLPSYGDYTPRAKVSEMLLAASSARTSITEAARKARSLERAGAGVEVWVGGKISAGVVANDGRIFLYNEELRVLVALYPSLEGEVVKWTCDVYPAKLGPSSCRTDSPAPPPTSGERKVPGTPASHATDLLALATDLKDEVAAAGAGGAREGAVKGRPLQPGEVLDVGLLDADGTIALYSERHGVFVLVESASDRGALERRCRAWPKDAASAGCPYGGASR